MPAKRDRRHIQVREAPSSESYTPHDRDYTPKALPSIDRATHARKLTESLRAAERQAEERKAAAPVHLIEGAAPGMYLEFESPPGIKLKLDSLEDRRGRKRPIELVAVKERPDGGQSAVVFVPQPKSANFNKKIDQYATTDTPIKGEPKNKDLVERIAEISLAALEGIWTDVPESFPADPLAKVWWEVWLRRSAEGGEYARFLAFADLVRIRASARRLQFEDRIVLLAKASATQLASALDALSGDVVEVRGAAHGAAPFDAMDPAEQAEWVEELLGRTSGPDDGAPAVCVLDTGVNRGHRLLANVLAEEDAHTVNPEWGTADHPKGSNGAGHGTEMAGLAAYGNLAPLLASSDPLVLRNRVEPGLFTRHLI